MAFQISTALSNKMLDTAPLRTVMNLGFIKIYAGTPPADADAAIGSATLLCTVSNNATATGLTLAATAAARTIAKNGSEVWSGVNAASGTAAFFRYVAVGDTGAASTTEARIQGTVGTGGADMNLSSVNLTSGAIQALDFGNFTLPTF